MSAGNRHSPEPGQAAQGDGGEAGLLIFSMFRKLAVPALLIGAALAALLVNDWVLKPGCLGPACVRGKLSDFAGLLLVPLPIWPLVALAVRVSSGAWPTLRTLEVGAAVWCLIVLLGFAGIKLSPDIARGAESIWPWPHGWGEVRLVPDPTDLVALPALWLGFRISRAMWVPILPVAEARLDR